MVITGDMQSVNKINFAIFRWFGPEFRPRFANLKQELGIKLLDVDNEDYKKRRDETLKKPNAVIGQTVVQ